MKTTIVLFFLCSVCFTFGQSSGLVLRFNSMEFSGSIFPTRAYNLPISDFGLLALNNSFPIQNFSGFTMDDFQPLFINESRQLAVGFHLMNRDGSSVKGRPFIRFGLGTENVQFAFGEFLKEGHVTLDSIYVDGSPDLHALDSFYRQSIICYGSSRNMSIHTSFVWQTNPNNKISFYAGFHLAFGFSLSSSLDYDYRLTTNKNIKTPTASEINSYDNKGVYIRDRIDAVPLKSFSFGVPFGFDLRFGKKVALWKNLRFFFETVPIVSSRRMEGFEPLNFSNFLFTAGLRLRRIE